MNDTFAAVTMTEEERREAQKIARAKSEGYRYIPIRYTGSLPLAAIRIHGARAIEVVEVEETDGTKSYQPVEGSGLLSFAENTAGEIVGQIWDDDEGYNRHWLRSMLDTDKPEIEVMDAAIAAEIMGLELVAETDDMNETVRKKFRDNFKVELTPDEKDLKEYKRLQAKLKERGVLKGETKVEPKVPISQPLRPEHLSKPERGRGQPPVRRNKNGVN